MNGQVPDGYSAASEVVDGHLASSIEGLRGTTEKGFDRVERRLDSMVTRDAFRAEVARLDQRDDHIESRMDAGFLAVESKMDAGFAAIAARDEQRDLRARERDADRDRKFARRMTWTISVASFAFVVFQFVVNSFIGA